MDQEIPDGIYIRVEYRLKLREFVTGKDLTCGEVIERALDSYLSAMRQEFAGAARGCSRKRCLCRGKTPSP